MSVPSEGDCIGANYQYWHVTSYRVRSHDSNKFNEEYRIDESRNYKNRGSINADIREIRSLSGSSAWQVLFWKEAG